MNIKQEIRRHNKFEVTVCDTVTGVVKQEAVAYNIITDDFFKMKFGVFATGNDPIYPTANMTYISVGTGTGTPAITDTALFTALLHRESTLLETHYEYPTSYIVRQIKLNADEYNGQTLTEVGLEHYYTYGMWSSAGYKLCTHAMLQDAEGNQIAIAKTDTDVVFIRATFYCTFTQTGWGDNGVYPEASKNTLIQWLLHGTDSLLVRTSRYPIEHSSDLNNDYEYTKTYRVFDGRGNMTSMTFNLPEITILDTEFNTHVVKNIGIAGFGAFQFPDASAFPDYAVTRLTLGDGDGETTEYNIKCPCIKPDSVHIYVGDVEKTEGTDYTIDLESNCNDARENYHTAGMNCKMANVSFGNMSSKSPSTSYYYLDPLYWGLYRSSEYLYPANVTVNADTPIWIDFGEAKECNALRIDCKALASASIGNFRIEYSEDNEHWTAVTATREETVYSSSYTYYKWKWEPVSARYWRCYISGYNWTYTLNYSSSSMGTRDGTTHIKSSFYLGKSKPGLVFTTPPAEGETVETSYLLNVPFKTPNNLMRIACSVQLQRG